MNPSELGTADAVVNAYNKEWCSTMVGKRAVVQHWDEQLCRPVMASMTQTAAALIAVAESVNAAHSAGFANIKITINWDKAVSLINIGPSNVSKKFQPLVADIYSYRNFFSTIEIQSPNDSVTLRNEWASL